MYTGKCKSCLAWYHCKVSQRWGFLRKNISILHQVSFCCSKEEKQLPLTCSDPEVPFTVITSLLQKCKWGKEKQRPRPRKDILIVDACPNPTHENKQCSMHAAGYLPGPGSEVWVFLIHINRTQTLKNKAVYNYFLSETVTAVGLRP